MPLSTFLNGRAVERLRGLQWLSFSETVTIQTPQTTSDSGGGGTIAWQNAGTTSGRIYPVTIRGKGGIIGGQLNERSTHFLSMPPATSIDTADRVLIAGRGTFEVTMALETTDALSTRVEVVQV